MTVPKHSVYASTKAALNKLTETAALELATHGIRVVGIAPGYTLIERSTQYEQKIAGRVPLKRVARPEEIGRAILYLASDAAASVSGTTITIDGAASLMTDF